MTTILIIGGILLYLFIGYLIERCMYLCPSYFKEKEDITLASFLPIYGVSSDDKSLAKAMLFLWPILLVLFCIGGAFIWIIFKVEDANPIGFLIDKLEKIIVIKNRRI